MGKWWFCLVLTILEMFWVLVLSELESSHWMSAKGFRILCWMALFLQFKSACSGICLPYILFWFSCFDFHIPMLLYPSFFFYAWAKSWPRNSHIGIWYFGQSADVCEVVWTDLVWHPVWSGSVINLGGEHVISLWLFVVCSLEPSSCHLIGKIWF